MSIRIYFKYQSDVASSIIFELYTSFLTVLWPAGKKNKQNKTTLPLKTKQKLRKSVVVYDILPLSRQLKANNELRETLTRHGRKKKNKNGGVVLKYYYIALK